MAGDVMAAGGSIDFDGTVGGSYLGGGGDQTVRGRIEGSVRGAGGTVLLDAAVGQNVTIVGGGVELTAGTVVDGNAYLAGGKVRVLGRVAGDLYVSAQEVELAGEVDGDVRLEAASVTVSSDARVGGELRYRVEEGVQARISPQATIVQGAVELEPRESGEGGLGLVVLRVLGFLLVGTTLVVLAPATIAAVVRGATPNAAAALGLGVLVLIGVPVGIVVVGATVIGIPLALVVAVLYGVSLYLAPIPTGLWLGGAVLRSRNPAERGNAVLLFLAGGALVAVAGFLPWVGWLARLGAITFGLGAVALMIRDRGRVPAGG
ncbi:MAG: hypothetical protein HKN72_13485 [Gemmatimonadetes bacterium]|nr:hypothetical protein [Gemmatimonadota bacterium]